jgi:molybdate transport system substrate-binding protein
MRRLTSALLVLTLLAAGCGGSGASGTSSSGGSGRRLTVFAATSLTNAFTELAKTFQAQHPGWKVQLSFAGSDALAAQIEQGVHADVYAAASTKYPEQLQGENMLGTTTNFATNSLVLIVPTDNPADIKTVADITGGAKLVVGDPAVPVGAYTETVLGNLGIDPASLKIVSREPTVTPIVQKIELGEADAGFVYVTDALAVKDKVAQIALPAKAQATAIYPIGIVSGSKQAKAAQQWIDLVTSAQGQRTLAGFGFGPAPSS